MNIFYLDKDPKIAAQYHNDKHVVKMILESCQLMSTAHRILDGTQSIGLSKTERKVKRWTLPDEREQILYIAGHVNHPSAVWVRKNVDHYRWLFDLTYYLIYEYKYRYDGKYHKCEALLPALMEGPNNIPVLDWEEPPQAMPDDSKVPGNSVEAYRNYYRNHKQRMASWKIRGTPNWYK